MPMHGRISAVRPSRAFATQSESAITPRPIPTKSTCPDATARSARSGNRIRPAAITGTSTSCFTAAAQSSVKPSA
jgi:hypothetical protein